MNDSTEELTKKLNIITSERMKARRKELSISFQELAELTHMSRSTLQRYETEGMGHISIDKLKRIADALNVTYWYLSGHESNEISSIEITDLLNMLRNSKIEVEYVPEDDTYFLKSEYNECFISPTDMKKVNDEISAFTRFKINEMINRHIKHEVIDPFKK